MENNNEQEVIEEEVIDEDTLQGGIEELYDHNNRMGSNVLNNGNDAMNPEHQSHSVFVVLPAPLGEFRGVTRYNLRQKPMKNRQFYNVI